MQRHNALLVPSNNFAAVRDMRSTSPLYIDIDLTTARSGATALILPIAGNSFYIDANPTDGFALVQFQDTSFDRSPAALYCGPGAIFNVPFTQVSIENPAQVGKKIRVVYGVDIDFQPGSVTQVALSGNLVNTPLQYNQVSAGEYFSQTPGNIVGNATQKGGVMIWNAANSGKSVYIDGFEVVNASAVVQDFTYGFNTAIAGWANNNQTPNMAAGSANSVSPLYVNDASATIIGVTTQCGTFRLKQDETKVLNFSSPFLLPASAVTSRGFGVVQNVPSANVFFFTVRFREA